jgi:hypothetical protein
MAAYEIVERDEAGVVMRTYVASGEGRIDVIVRDRDRCTHVSKVQAGVLMSSRVPQRPRAMFSRCLMYFYLRDIHRALVRIIYSMAQQLHFWE